jgi:putative glutamine amidotransferase
LKPIIGLTSQYEQLIDKKMVRVNNTYIEAVKQSGGIPLILPILDKVEDLDEILKILDGIILTGGEDISSLSFGEEPIKEVDTICLARDKIEKELFHSAYEKNIPILGICRGLQIINISLGGTLYQDINTQLPNSLGHLCTHNVHQGYHTIKLKEDSKLYNIFKTEELIVNSQHHQSIKDLGRDLKITSTTKDGIVESIESTNDKFVLGVQFHPEAMIHEDNDFIFLFNYFMEICKK